MIPIGNGQSITIPIPSMMQKPNPKKAILDFIMNNPNPVDEDFHDLAEELGMDAHRLEEMVYVMFHNFLNNIGKHRDVPEEEFDSEQLKMGINVEYEHTNIPYIALQIAKDHLAELPDYYSRLKAMEDEGKKYWKMRNGEDDED